MPLFKRSTVRSRACWFMSPLSGAAEKPSRSNNSASCTVSLRVRTKTIAPSYCSASKKRTIALFLCTLAFQNTCSTDDTVELRAEI